MKKLTFCATLIVAIFALALNGFGQVTLPHLDAIDYSVGSTLQTQTGWTAVNSGDDILVTSGNLNYSGLQTSSGNKISFGGSGIDASKAFTSQSTNTVYYSFLMNVTALNSLNAVGGYFTGLATNATTFGATVWTGLDGTGYKIGINPRSSNSASTVWVSGTQNLNSEMFVVISYEFVTGAGNDIVNIWVNPSSSAFGSSSSPVADVTVTNTGGTDLASIGQFFIRQDSDTETPFIDMDELRIGLTWASVTPSSGGMEPPVLTPDITNNNVDNNIDITFTDNPTWRAAVTSVSIDGTPLNALDYTFTAGNLRLLPSVGNPLLTAAGSKNVSVTATGYNYATVVQQINAGAISAGNSTATINQDLALNSTSTVTCTAMDMYDNPIEGYTFRADIQIFNLNTALTEIYVVDGVNYSSTPAPVNLTTATNASGIATFDITIPAVVNLNDGIDVQVQTSAGTNVGTDFFYTPSSPVVQITGEDPGTNPLQTSSINNVLYRSAIQVINDAVTLNSVTTATGGTYQLSVCNYRYHSRCSARTYYFCQSEC